MTQVRAGASIGAGLAAARDPRPIARDERIHVVGVAGAGASAAALLASWAGASATGCDPGAPSPYTPALDRAGIAVAPAHDPRHVTTDPPPDRLAVSKALTAIAPDHPELAAAREHRVPLEAWQQIVADAAHDRLLVGVAGTHGKSTTAGWLVHVLVRAGVDPASFVGALLPAGETGLGVQATARRGSGRPFVVEADEYAGNFDPYRPVVAVLTSAEWDHPDVFADEAAVLDVFEAWIRRFRGVPTMQVPALVANVGDPGVARVVERLIDWPGRVVATALVDGNAAEMTAVAGQMVERFGTAPGRPETVVGRVVSADRGATMLEVAGLERDGVTVARLPTAGRHNAANALGVLGAAITLGVDVPNLLAGLASFPGIGRRLERKGEAGGVVVYDDYGHHPTAIRETLLAVRQREPGRRVWAVYEPLTYHRTAAFLERFAEVLATADGV
ncbi:MAG: glutamate ligase domain-containing protein, partial [Chloroflexota bacterium]